MMGRGGTHPKPERPPAVRGGQRSHGDRRGVGAVGVASTISPWPRSWSTIGGGDPAAPCRGADRGGRSRQWSTLFLLFAAVTLPPACRRVSPLVTIAIVAAAVLSQSLVTDPSPAFGEFLAVMLGDLLRRRSHSASRGGPWSGRGGPGCRCPGCARPDGDVGVRVRLRRRVLRRGLADRAGRSRRRGGCPRCRLRLSTSSRSRKKGRNGPGSPWRTSVSASHASSTMSSPTA